MRLAAVAALSLFACQPDVDEGSSGGGGGPYTGTTAAPAAARAAELTGGTVELVDDRLVAVSDAELDRIVLFDVKTGRIKTTVDLPPNSRAGRMASDHDGTLWVVLRGRGALAKVHVSSADVISTRDVCADPRGVAWDEAAGLVRVACGNGRLVSLPREGPAVAAPFLGADLRDVVLTPAGVTATTFRSAELVSPSGAHEALPEVPSRVAHVAWRALPFAGGRIVIAHQREVAGPVESAASAPGANPYGASTARNCAPPCFTPVVRSALTVVGRGESVTHELAGVLPVDLAISPDGSEAAVALAGSGLVERVSLSALTPSSFDGCQPDPRPGAVKVDGTPDGVVYTPTGALVVHTTRPDAIAVVSPSGDVTTVALAGRRPDSTGQQLFHAPVNRVACASCHPEGRDDGHVWNVGGKQRRTPSLAGGVMKTAPFHWEGELADLDALVDDTLVKRMGGAKQDVSTVRALGDWLDGIPEAAPTALLNPKLFAKAKAVFDEAGCASCHLGPSMTSNATLDVGTGGRFQVPSLRGVSARAPYLHDGRATTLHDRFAPMGGGDHHGNTSALGRAEIDLLVGYLETL